MTAPIRRMNSDSPPSIDNQKTITQLSLLGIRADELADRVRLGEIGSSMRSIWLTAPRNGPDHCNCR